jgi:flagellar L-ring protein precursor FlgH
MIKWLRSCFCTAIGVCMLPLGYVSAEEPTDPAMQAPYRSFFSDRHAYRKGDLLTIIITESAAAASTARTRADKSDQVGASLSQPGTLEQGFSIGANNDFSGGGEIQRTGKLLGRLTVVVDAVDSNGNLRIVGDQTIYINNEQQRIALHGIVRPEDIAPDNTLPSWRISAAEIEFKGKGILARKQSPGLLAKLFDLFGLN